MVLSAWKPMPFQPREGKTIGMKACSQWARHNYLFSLFTPIHLQILDIWVKMGPSMEIRSTSKSYMIPAETQEEAWTLKEAAAVCALCNLSPAHSPVWSLLRSHLKWLRSLFWVCKHFTKSRLMSILPEVTVGSLKSYVPAVLTCICLLSWSFF